MSIASRLTSIEKHIEEAYTEISRLGVDLTNVDKNIDNIADMLQEAYENTPKVTGEGSSLSLSPTREGGLSIIPKGACEQDSYSGKNKLNASAESYTLPASTNKYQVVGNVDLVENTKYYISYNIDNASTSNLRSTPYIKIGTGIKMYQNISENYNITTGRKVWEFTPLETATYDFGYWINNSNVAVTISDFMISTSNDTTYEKYVGGIPSPNPDYPQQIKVVTDNLPNEYQKVEYIEATGTQYIKTGINSDTSKTSCRIKADINWSETTSDKYMGANNGTFIGCGYNTKFNAFGVTTDVNTVINSFSNWDVSINYSTKEVSGTINDTAISGTRSSAISNSEICLFTLKDGSSYTNYLCKCKVKKFKIYYDDILAFDFIPCYRKSDNVIGMYDRVNGVFYTNQGTGTFAKGSNVYSNEIVVGGNIFDGIIETGSIYKGNNSVTDNNIRSKNYSEVIGGETYNFYVNGTLNRVAIVAYDTNHSWIGDYGGDHGYQTETGVFTVPQNAKYIRFRSYQADYNLFNTGTITIIGAKETYPIHLGTNYLAGIGTYKDEIVGKTDDWKIRRNVGKVVLNGSENWQGPTNNRFEMDSNLVDSTNTLGFCNYFKNVNTWQLHEITNNSAVAFKYDAWQYGRFSINSNEFADTTELKTWLSTHNTIMYYIHATPTEETITDQILIADLNNMYQAMGYDGTTNITITSDSNNAQMIASVSALKGE